MGRERRKRPLEKDGDWGPPVPQLDVEVLIARDPNMPVDSDDEIELGAISRSLVQAASLSGRSSSGERNRRDSHSSSSSNQKTRKKRNSKEKDKKKEVEVNEDGVDNEEVFYVEKIRDKRWNLTQWEYLLQWQGYGPEHDTWEPTSNMDCEDLLKEFEAKWQKKAKYGFDQGKIAREIVGLCIVKGKPMFMVLWHGSDDAEYVPKEECSKRCPQLLIEFYETRQLAKPGEDLIENIENKVPDVPATPVSSVG